MSLLLQALKKAEQRNADAVAAQPEDGTAVATTAAGVPAPQTPVFPAIDLQIQADAASSEPIANPVFAQSGLQPATAQSGDVLGLSLIGPLDEEADAVSEPAYEYPELSDSPLTVTGRPLLNRPAATAASAATTAPSASAAPAAASATAASASRAGSQPAGSTAPTPESVRFMTYKRDQLAKKNSRGVARWVPWSATAVALLLFVLYLGVEFFAPAPPTVTASAPTPIPVVVTIPNSGESADAAVSAEAAVVPPAVVADSVPASPQAASSLATQQDSIRSSGASAATAVPDSPGNSVRTPAPAAVPERPEVNIRKETVKTGMDELDLAYQELVRGSLPVAERRYRDLLAKDRLNPDIWTGLGAVLLRLGKPEEAESMFRRAQELNPTDPYTRAMLLSLSRSPDAYKDSQYTTLANNAGQSASQAAAFALLAAEHAAAKRWNEAQQAFFNALTADPGNPDYAYNLAVTLEHMRQPRLAYDFYRQALEFAKSKRPGFDLPRAQSRLLALKPAE